MASGPSRALRGLRGFVGVGLGAFGLRGFVGVGLGAFGHLVENGSRVRIEQHERAGVA
ncbi:MAG: hypothetical protein WBM50_10650 [Acidimicrobiales bacterium]